MSTPIHLPTLRTRNIEALQLARTRTTPAGLARVLNRDRSTLTRGKRTPAQISWDEVLRLAAFDGEFRSDLVAALTEQNPAQQRGEPLEAEADLRALVRTSAHTIAEVMARLEGGLTAAEAREVLPLLEADVATMQRAVRDVRAKAGRGR